MISWKHSLMRLNEEFVIAKKKKQALDNLLAKNKISQTTYESFDKEIEEAITEIEKQQQALQERMRTKTEELEGQIKTLETLLANFEIQHVIGEVDDEVYQRQIDMLSIGLENSRQELDIVKGAIDELSNGNTALFQNIAALQPESIQISRTEVENVDVSTSTTKERIAEPLLEPEDTQPKENEIENEEKQET